MKTIIVLFPGASLMNITPVGEGIRVSCPGCGREETYTGEEKVMDFFHRAGCRVERLISKALKWQQGTVN